MRAIVLLSLAAAVLVGCGDRASIEEGGRVPGDILTVYTLVPDTQEGTDLVRGAKLALSQAGGHIGKLTVQFASAREPDGNQEAVASAVRDVVRDTGTIAVIGDLDSRTASVSAPLLNAVGLLQVSPLGPTSFAQPGPAKTFFGFGPTAADEVAAIAAGARGPFAVESEPGGAALAAAVRERFGRTVDTARARTVIYAGSDAENARGVIAGILSENRRATVVVPPALAALAKRKRVRALVPASGLPPGFGDAFPGVLAGPYARAGFDAMNAVLAALRSAGRRAQTRKAVIRAFRAPAAGRLVLAAD